MKKVMKTLGAIFVLAFLIAIIVGVFVLSVTLANHVFLLAFAMFGSKVIAWFSALGTVVLVLNLASLSID